mmetsp:Transcript_47226/g.55147  ORF Transcript_47226/g.55147 Transcript_47226/m.55147 type:complete len:209 (-) Transcript_47226:276-902(-)
MIRRSIHQLITNFSRNASICFTAKHVNTTNRSYLNLWNRANKNRSITNESMSSVSAVFGRTTFSTFSYSNHFQLKSISDQNIFDSSTPCHINQQTRHRSNRSRRGLYDGKDVRTGNKVSFSEKKTKRKFKPNVQKKRLFSEILDEMIRFNVTTSALRSIDKAGGLDNYLLKSKHVTDEGTGGEAKRRILDKMEELRKGELKNAEQKQK